MRSTKGGAFVGLIVGIAFTGIGWYMRGLEAEVQAYVPTKGTVISSQVASEQKRSSSRSRKGRSSSRMTTHYWPEVSYQYTVNGKQYSGSKVAYMRSTSSSSGWANSVVSKHPKGKQCTVYYDAKDPSKSVLLKDVGGFAGWMPSLFFYAGILVLVASAGGVVWFLVIAGVVGASVLKGRSREGSSERPPRRRRRERIDESFDDNDDDDDDLPDVEDVS
jgi:hypothetical protein